MKGTFSLKASKIPHIPKNKTSSTVVLEAPFYNGRVGKGPEIAKVHQILL